MTTLKSKKRELNKPADAVTIGWWLVDKKFEFPWLFERTDIFHSKEDAADFAADILKDKKYRPEEQWVLKKAVEKCISDYVFIEKDTRTFHEKEKAWLSENGDSRCVEICETISVQWDIERIKVKDFRDGRWIENKVRARFLSLENKG